MASHTAKKKMELTAQTRDVLGHKVRHIRAEGILPAVLYGKGQTALNLQVPVKEFDRILKEAGESTLVYLKVGEATYPILIHDVARHPLSGDPIHADFYKVRLDEKITTNVPVVFVGVSPAVADLGGIFVRNVNELEVQALPADLPHEISVDISTLVKFGDQLTLKDIHIPNAVLTGGADEVLATVQEPKSEEELAAELAAPTTDISAVEEIKKEVVEEVPAEGEESTEPAAATPSAEEK